MKITQKYCSKECREKNREIWIKEYNKNYRKNNKEYFKKWNKEHQKERCKYRKDQRRRYRLRVLEHYGGNPPKCACCGENQLEFLTIDHKMHDGSRHRKTIGHATIFYRWIFKNNFPEDFQVLCFNCNCGREIAGGICPHKNKENN